jgi:DNA-binding winged helix-turn-helix (wHTH) protein
MHVSFLDMQIRFADIELDTLGYLLQRAGRRVPLRPKVFDLLIHLALNRERVVPRDELVALLWGQTVVGTGSLSGLVNELRAALGERGGAGSSIRTVHARGYQFVAEVWEEIGEDRPEIASTSGAQAVCAPQPSGELMDEIHHRISIFITDEIRPILEAEGVERLSRPIVQSLLRDLASPGGQSRRRGFEPVDGRSTQTQGRADRHMRFTRSRRPKQEGAAG